MNDSDTFGADLAKLFQANLAAEANILNRIIPKSGAVSVDKLKEKFSAFEWMKIPKLQNQRIQHIQEYKLKS
ncbi:hypothetical protein PAPYR_7929 [Paratrimastix pyriformis]|uniref:Uncharacterized protein n=1 Tax=Paratrimastix pyriformis TaxID=342808 RepID=A0ABQ8UIS7_9EUKA|nr:hypothetical protein PAPYR_7929 [Paratrimastix pyriformis]